MLHLLLKGEFIDHFVFNNGFVELLVSGGGPKNKPKILISLRSRGDIDCGDALLLLVEVLGFVVNKEVMRHDFELLAKSIVVGLAICSQPLVGHLMLDEDCIISLDGGSSQLESLVGVWVFQNPVRVVVVLQHEDYFLKARDLNGTESTFEYLLMELGSL
jgi:hypothetical protein